MRNRSRHAGLAVGLGLLVLWPATAAVAQTPAVPQTAPPATTTQPTAPERPDPTKVVPIAEPDPLELLQNPGDEIKLSDEKRITRWAHAQATAKIRLSPQASSRMITRLRFFTEDKLPEVYPVLGARMDSAGRRWVHIRVPKRPNGKTGWVLDEMVGQFYIVRTLLVIDRRKLRATLYKGGKKIWSARVGIGKRGTPTPRGQFWIRERLKGIGGNGTYGAVGVRHERVLEPLRLAGRRRRRDPRHQPAGPHPRAAVARLRPRAQRQDPPARQAHADRHAREHHQLTAGPGRATLPAHIRG